MAVKLHRKRPTSIQLDAKLKAAIAAAAVERKCTSSDLIRAAVTAALDICPTCGHRQGQEHKQARSAA